MNLKNCNDNQTRARLIANIKRIIHSKRALSMVKHDKTIIEKFDNEELQNQAILTLNNLERIEKQLEPYLDEAEDLYTDLMTLHRLQMEENNDREKEAV